MTVVHLLLVAAFTLEVVERQRAFLARQSREQMDGLAKMVAVGASSWLLANDVAGLGELVASLEHQPELRYAMVVSSRGQVLAHSDPSRIGQYLGDPESLAMLAGGAVPRVVHADDSLLDVAAPVLSSAGEPIGWVRIGQGQESIGRSLAAVRRNGLLYGLLATLLGVLFASVVGFRLSSRVRRLLVVSQGVRAGDVALRARLGGRDEIGQLGAGLDAMLDDLQAQERETSRLEAELQHAQKLESIGRLAGGVAHDFNNLLTVIVGNAEVLQQDLPEGDQRSSAAEIVEAGHRATEVTRGLLAFSRKQLLSPVRLDLRELLQRMQRLVTRLIGEDIVVEVRAADRPLEVIGNRGQLEQVIMNLATNARDAMQKGGKLTLEAAEVILPEAEVVRRGLADGRMILVSVRDTGVGMDASTQGRVFDPFFTTKEVGKGTGLGLAMAYGILRQHRGFIEVRSAPGKGATFLLYLPEAPPAMPGSAPAEEAVAVAAPSEPPTPERGAAEWLAPATPRPVASTAPVGEPSRGTILLAEDDEALRNFATRVLRQGGYRVIGAANGREAVLRFAEHRDEVALCLFDLVMPVQSGRSAFDEIRRQAPGMPVLFVSGYSPETTFLDSPPTAGSLLLKPYLPSELLARVQAVLEKARVERR